VHSVLHATFRSRELHVAFVFFSPPAHSFIFPFVLFMSFLFVLLKARVLDVFLSRVLRIHLGNTPDSVCRIVI
jgi:hypothetical protein